jgi:hypothetical protein
MANYSNTEDEIPYPLPPTTVSLMLTKQTMAPPIVFQVPPKTSNCGQHKGKEAFGKEKKPARTVGGGSSHFPWKKVFLFDNTGRNSAIWQHRMADGSQPT